MHGNYRHHQYLMSTPTAPATSQQTTSSPAQLSSSSAAAAAASKSRQQQQHLRHSQPTMANHSAGGGGHLNFTCGLPASNGSRMHQAKQTQEFHADQVGNFGGSFGISSYGASRIEQQQQQQQVNRPPRATGREYCTSQQVEVNNQRSRQQQQQPSFNQANNNNNNNNSYQAIQAKQREFIQQNQYFGGGERRDDAYEEDCDVQADGRSAMSDGHRHNQQHYASQLRNSHLQHRFHHQQQQQPINSPMHRGAAGPSRASPAEPHRQTALPTSAAASSSSAAVEVKKSIGFHQAQRRANSPSKEQSAGEQRALHVNFNRANRSGSGAAGCNEDEEEEGDCRKKKYLTAKYGQQQMNLIKKRLKIEMWLFERLKELAKGSKSEAELDEIDLDLDQLLDMDNDDTRRRWLKKTLEPFEDLANDKIEIFIDDVLEQSKLL